MILCNDIFMWVKQSWTSSPSHHKYIGGRNLPFPVSHGWFMTVFYPRWCSGQLQRDGASFWFKTNGGSVGCRAGIAAMNDSYSYVVTIVGIIAVIIHVAIVQCNDDYDDWFIFFNAIVMTYNRYHSYNRMNLNLIRTQAHEVRDFQWV